MYDPYSLNFDQERYIRENLRFLLDSDEEYSDNSGNGSMQLLMSDGKQFAYGVSNIDSTINETWSSTSNGSIVSPRQSPSNLSRPNPNWSNSWSNMNLSTSSSFSLEDIYFGQSFNHTADALAIYNKRQVDLALYRLWGNSEVDMSFLRNEFICGQQVLTLPRQQKVINNSQYINWNNSYKMSPYSQLTVPINRGIDTINLSSRSDPNCSKFFPWAEMKTDQLQNTDPGMSMLSNNPTQFLIRHPREDPDKHSMQQSVSNIKKVTPDPDISSFRSDTSFKEDFPVSRTSTPIKKYSSSEAFVSDGRNFVPCTEEALKCEYNVKKFKDTPQVSNRSRFERESIQAEPPRLENAPPPKPVYNRRPEKIEFCKFCYKNGELSDVYASHTTRAPDGKILCPILRKYVCDICGATGDNAHTRKYCSLNSETGRSHPTFRRLTNGLLTTSHNHK